jgi:ABC-type multidrug transport system fused ATPase/permease subunit
VMLLAAAISFALSRPLERAVRDLRRRRGALTDFISGRLGAVASIQAMGRARHERSKVLSRNEDMNEAGLRRAWVVGAMRGIVHFATLMLVLATLFAGASEVAAGRLAPGEVVAALSIVGLLGSAIRDLGRAFELWYPACVARERILRRLNQPITQQSESQQDNLKTIPGGLVFSGFGAAGYLKDISLSLAEGEVALIEGPSGAGKSLLLGAVAQLADQPTGAAYFRGKNLGSLKLGARRRTIGLASATAPLLPGSLGMNLRYRVPDVPAEEIDQIIEDCGLTQLLARLPRGQGSVLVSGGAELSLGEQQSAMLARALLGTPPVLLLDSIDSHLTPEVVTRLAARLRTWPGVVLMAATRPELIACATRVWRLDSRRIIEEPCPQAAGKMVYFPVRSATFPTSEGTQP